MQEALVRAWQQLPSLRDPDRFDAWLYRLVVNACADQGRQLRRWSQQVRPLPLERLRRRRHRCRRRSGAAGAGLRSTEARAAGGGRPPLLQRVLGSRDRANPRHPRGDRQITTSLRDRGDACGARGRRASASGRPEQDCVMARTNGLTSRSASGWRRTAPAQLPERVLSATFERTRAEQAARRAGAHSLGDFTCLDLCLRWLVPP